MCPLCKVDPFRLPPRSAALPSPIPIVDAVEVVEAPEDGLELQDLPEASPQDMAQRPSHPSPT